MRAEARHRRRSETAAQDTAAGADILLRTKSLVPPPPPGFMERERLRRLLPRLSEARVSLLKAPSGHGKTVVASEWARVLKASGQKVAWLTLDSSDDEPTRYLHYLAASLAQAIPDIAMPPTTSDALLPPRMRLSALINALAEHDEALYLFIDNYSYIADPSIVDAMNFLLQYGPQSLHLVLIGRSEPQLPLGLLRASGNLLEIDVRQLSFDLDETRQYLTQEQLSLLSPAEAQMLQQKTGGWIAALRIVCHNLREASDPHASLRLLSGGSKHIGAYLGEMLVAIPAPTRDMMLRISILDQLSAPLCHAVTQIADAQALLETLASRYQLIIALDDEERWFRHQPLIAEYLRKRLQSEHPQMLAELHRRAAHWHAEQGLWTEAITHAITAGEQEQALAWIEQNVVAALQHGDLLTVIGWHRRFPDAMLRFPPAVLLNIALTHLLAARLKDGEGIVAATEARINELPAEQRPHLLWQCRILRAAIAAICDDDIERSLALALDCLKENHDDSWMADAAVNVARFCHAKRGDLVSFHTLPWHAGADSSDPHFIFSAIYRLCFQGMAETAQLDFRSAERSFREACDIARRHQGDQSSVLAVPTSFLAQMHYEQDRIDDAEALLAPRLELIHAAGALDVILSAHLVLARIALLRGNIEQAYALLEQGENIGHIHAWGRLRAAMLAERLRIVLGEGRLMEAAACLAQLQRIAADHPVTARCAWSQIHDLLALSAAQMHYRQGELDRAIEELTQLVGTARRDQQPYLLLQAKTALAVARMAAGDQDRAAEDFDEVLALGTAAGALRLIVDQGPELETLLDAARARHTDLAPYIEKLHRAWRRLYKPVVGAAASASVATSEPLSPRERGVLELVAAGQSNKEIAREFSIAPETVKWHLKNIFVKLDVNNRAQAVARLKALQGRP